MKTDTDALADVARAVKGIHVPKAELDTGMVSFMLLMLTLAVAMASHSITRELGRIADAIETAAIEVDNHAQ